MKTQAEAVAYLKARGLHAVERDWAMGQSILVFTGPQETELAITVYRRAVCIAPQGEGWAVEELESPFSETGSITGLADACARAEAILSKPRRAR
jgi:hypothetical protein